MYYAIAGAVIGFWLLALASSYSMGVSLTVLMAGIVLTLLGVKAVDSGSDFIEPDEQAVWMLIGGIVVTIIGMAGSLRAPKPGQASRGWKGAKGHAFKAWTRTLVLLVLERVQPSGQTPMIESSGGDDQRPATTDNPAKLAAGVRTSRPCLDRKWICEGGATTPAGHQQPALRCNGSWTA
jgi:hypothetical protein